MRVLLNMIFLFHYDGIIHVHTFFIIIFGCHFYQFFIFSKSTWRRRECHFNFIILLTQNFLLHLFFFWNLLGLILAICINIYLFIDNDDAQSGNGYLIASTEKYSSKSLPFNIIFILPSSSSQFFFLPSPHICLNNYFIDNTMIWISLAFTCAMRSLSSHAPHTRGKLEIAQKKVLLDIMDYVFFVLACY